MFIPSFFNIKSGFSNIFFTINVISYTIYITHYGLIISVLFSEILLALPKQHHVEVVFLRCSSGGGIRTTRPPGYEPDELPLLYPAIYFYGIINIPLFQKVTKIYRKHSATYSNYYYLSYFCCKFSYFN